MRTAVVVGGGVGGLAVAGALSRSDWQVTLVERDSRLRGGGAALLIWPNGVAALRALGLGRGLDAIAAPTTASGVRRPDGRWLVEAPAVPDQPMVVHADDLHDTLMAGLGETLEIRTATEVTGVRAAPGDRPAVTTGRYTFEADLVVAADGVDSLLRRRALAGASPVPGGFTTWRAVIPWFRAPKLSATVPPAGEMLGSGRRFVHATLGERGSAGGSSRGGIYWVATAPGAARPESPTTQLALLRRWFADWQAPVGDLLAATEPDDLVQRAGQELRPLPPRFDTAVGGGGLVLLGDAAHASTPNLVQGACLAFEDAATLRALVAPARPGRELVAALQAYTRVRRSRVTRLARSSHRLGRVLQAQGRLTTRARDAALGAVAPRLFGRARDTAADWQPPS